MEAVIKCLLLKNDLVLISEIIEVGSELGEPDCKLTKPFEVSPSITGEMHLKPWNDEYTSQDVFMISSDKILTLVDPKPTLLEKYQNLIK